MAKLVLSLFVLGVVASVVLAAPAAEPEAPVAAESAAIEKKETKDLDTAAGNLYGGYGGKMVLGV